MDIQKLSFAELQALLHETQAAIDHKRVEEIKVLADGYAKKLQMNGFSIAEGIEALKPYLPARAPSAAKPAAGTSDRAPQFRNPANPAETWVGLGKQPQWFKDALAQGATKDSLRIAAA